MLLVQLVGDDLTLLLGEVAKAALAGGPDNRRVTPSEVRAVVGEQRLRHIFELTRAVAERDLGAALGVLGALLAAGEEPLGVLGMLAREARSVWQAREWLGQGRRDDEVARLLRRPPAAAAAVVALARALSGPDAARAPHALLGGRAAPQAGRGASPRARASHRGSVRRLMRGRALLALAALSLVRPAPWSRPRRRGAPGG